MKRDDGERIANLETATEGTRRDLVDLGKRFDQQFSVVFHKIDDLTNALALRARTPWGSLIAAMTLAVMILGGLIALGSQGPLGIISRHDDELRGLREQHAVDIEKLESRIHRTEDAERARSDLWVPRLARLEAFDELKARIDLIEAIQGKRPLCDLR